MMGFEIGLDCSHVHVERLTVIERVCIHVGNQLHAGRVRADDVVGRVRGRKAAPFCGEGCQR